jgi:hypothetical protein
MSYELAAVESFEHDLYELSKLRHQIVHLERLAYYYERYSGACTGRCERPAKILMCEDTGEYLMCCNLRPVFDRYHEARKMEKILDAKVRAERRRLQAEQETEAA